MKSAPWSFAMAGVILVVAIAGVIYGVVTKGGWEDRGLMVKDGNPLKWPRDRFPLPVWYAGDLADEWLAAWVSAAVMLNEAVGRPLFMEPLEIPLGLDGATVQGISLRDDNDMDPHHGVTALRWKADGTILTAAIVVPEAYAKAPQRDGIMLHEAAHALGLEHDETRDSILYPVLQDRPQELSAADRKLLKAVYG